MDQRLIFWIVLTIFVSFKYEADAAPPLRIVNGTTADEGEFPYIVELRDEKGYFMCGGAIIGPEWILTAGSCVKKGQIDSVVYGTNRLYDYGDVNPNTSINVKNWFQHPKYLNTRVGVRIYDVGLLQLETPIPLGATAQTIKLAEANATIPLYVQGTLSGWGVNNTWGDLDKYLQTIDLPLLSDEECTKKIDDYSGDESFVAVHSLCSDDYYNGQCFGDAGSPYVINGTLYGLVSWSYIPCGIVPGAYSRIPNPEYRNWIIEVANI